MDAIDPDEADRQFGVGLTEDEEEGADDPYPHVVSVRQRRDYRVPSVGALIRVAEAARRTAPSADGLAAEPVESVGEALLELMQAGDGSLGALDIPELESLNGVVVVAEVGAGLDPEAFEDVDGTGPFQLDAGDRLVDRLDEHAYVELDSDGVVDNADDQAQASRGR